MPVAYKLLKSRLPHSPWEEIALMNTFPVPLKVVVTTLLSAILILVGILNLRDRAAWSDPTDGVFWTEADGVLKAAEVDDGGRGMRAGIRAGDRLVSFNGRPISSLGQYSDWIYQAGIGSSVSYTLAGEAGDRTVNIRLGSKPFFTPRDGLRSLLAFLHLGIGIFVLFRGSHHPRLFHFYLICLAAFVIYLFSWTPKLSALDWWVYVFSVLSFLILPALFVHFCLRFPLDLISRGSRAWLLYIPAIFFILMQLLWITGHLAPIGLPRTQKFGSIIDQAQLAYFSVGLLAGGIVLLKRRLQIQNLVARQQMKWIGYGTLAGVAPFTLIYALPVLLAVRPNFAMEASMLFLGLIPLSMGYALIHYRLMDVEVIARRGAAYFISSSLLLAVYLLFVLVLGRAFQWVAPQADFLAICLAVLMVALLFAPLRDTVQACLDRRFYKDQFEERSTLLDFAHTLGSEIRLAPLARGILERIARTFQVEQGAIFLADPVHAGFFGLTCALDRDTLAGSRLYRADELVGKEHPGDFPGLKGNADPLRLAGPVLAKAGLHYVQDLKLRGKRMGIIAFGRLPKGKHFSTEDLDLLSALAGYAAMALENASLYRSVETKAAELERLKAYADNIIESINVAVLAIDFSGRVTSCNRAFEELYDTTRGQILGDIVENVLPGNVIASTHAATGRKDWEHRLPANIFKLYLENRGGRKLIVNLSVIPLQSPVASGPGSLIVLDDITEKARLEDQLLQAEKLSSIGLLAAGIAHEVNTPIAGISSYTQMLLKDTPESDKRKPMLEKIEKQTFRAAEIVNGLLNFSRLNGSEFTELDVNQLINDSLSLLDHQLELNQIRVESRFDSSLPPVYGNMGKLQQVFINLFLNARDAMPSGGELAVQTGMDESMVVVDISDTGPGIPEENIKRIFDPFFTTKAMGRGTGLGLAVTYGIIQEHGGGIFVDSGSGGGTHFRLKLPTRLH
jgi:PAS domain S-box-containing protein